MLIVDTIKQDIFSTNGKQIDNLHLIREKWGVHVYSCSYEGCSAVVKHFENEDDKREINNYRILNKHNIPTIKVFAYGKSSIVMEDISKSTDWRLGIKEDLHDTDVAKSLAYWYFIFHEKGLSIPKLHSLESDFDKITEATLNMLCEELPAASDTFKYILSRYGKLRELIDTPTYTLTYNDFYWTNFIVRKDKQEAIMFDYNLLGRGYRYSDFRNVCWSMSDEAGKIFIQEYNRSYVTKYGICRAVEEEAMEKQIDDVMDKLHGLLLSFERKNFYELEEFAKNEAMNGTLIKRAMKLLK